MKMNVSLSTYLESIGEELAENGRQADREERFSRDNLEILKEAGIYSALVPEEFGGAGLKYSEVCDILRKVATYHPSTALACSMHTHIVAANRFNHAHGKPGQAVLEKVGAGKILISTGAGDWLASNGELEPVEGGYRFTGMKHFGSGSPVGDVLVTSAPLEDPEAGWQVLHFPVPMSAEGVTVLDNWHPMGMRGSGSNSVKLENVFIPEESVAVRRPRGDFHAMWCVILPVALPAIMSVYRGVAESAADKARARCKDSDDPVTPYILGEMENALTTAQVMVDDMVRLANELDFEAGLELVNEIVKRKTIAAEACKEVCRKALEACGGQGFMQSAGIESLLRDVMASHYHPLQEKRQQLFSGSIAMGKEPPGQAF